MRSKAVLAGIMLILACLGCGRKLPPLPPEAPDPVEISSIRFEDGQVLARVRCNVPDAEVSLLGKPKGICPHCTDDLSVKDTAMIEKPGDTVLTDQSPQDRFMVYRMAVQYGGTRWMTPARIVVKK